MDNFEKYIKSHRDQFDDRNPDPLVWERISAQLPVSRTEGRRVAMWKLTAAAAAVVALVMMGIVAGMYMNRGVTMDPAYADFMETQKYYQSQYTEKKSELSQYVYDPEVDEDLQELDRMYQELSEELATTNKPNKSELINAMIEVYRTRIELLERVMTQIENKTNAQPTNLDDENLKI